MQEKIVSELKKLSEGLNSAKTKKFDAVMNQRYELAAAYRDEELSFINRIENTIDIKESDFDSKELLDIVKIYLYEIIKFIEDGDTNLTPALIRKLTNDTKESNKKAEELKRMMSWSHIYDERPELKYEIELDGRNWIQSDEVIILHTIDSGEYDVCIGRYVVESLGAYDKVYYFSTKLPGKSINLIDVKGWKYINGESSGCIKFPEK